MKRLVWNELEEASRRAALARPDQRANEYLQASVRKIVEEVRDRDWAALTEIARQIDGEEPRRVAIGQPAEKARRNLPAAQVEAMEFAAERVRTFHEASLPSDFAMETVP